MRARPWAVVVAAAAAVAIVAALRGPGDDEPRVLPLPAGAGAAGIVVEAGPEGRERVVAARAPARAERFAGDTWIVPAPSGRRLRWHETRGGEVRPSVSFLCVGRGRHFVEGGYGRLWVTNAADGTVTVLDPAAREPTTSAAPVEIAVGGVPLDLAVGAGAVWVPVDDGLGDGRLVRIDPAGLRTGTVDVPGRPRSVAVSRATGTVWVAVADAAAPRARPGRVIRVDAADVPLASAARAAPAPPCGRGR